MKKMLIQAGMLGVMVVSLTACGDNTDHSGQIPAVEKINGIEVPPAPDKATNNATLAGVDSNANGVRDDVEREIASKSRDIAQYNRLIVIANGVNKILGIPESTTPTKKDLLKIYSQIDCAVSSVKTDDLSVGEITTLNNNTPQRKQYFKSKLGDFSYFSDELDCGSK